MKTLRQIMLALAASCSASEAFAQEQLKIFGTVTDEFDRPLVKIKISLKYIVSSESKARGEFFFVLPKEITSGMPVEFEVANDTLAIFAPSRGIWNVPQQPRSQPVQIKLLPKRDHRFLSKFEMKDLMNEIIQERAKKETRLQAQVTQLKQQLAETPKDPLADEAKRLGFSKEDLLTAIEKAKQQLQESDDPYEVGLVKLYDKHFGEAARLIEQAIQRSEKTIAEAEQEKEKLPDKLINLGNAYIGEKKSELAVNAYMRAISLRPNDERGYILLANAYLLMYNFKAMQIFFTNALFHMRNKKLRLEAIILNILGLFNYEVGKRDSALVYYFTALKIYRKIGYRQGEASVLGNVGLVFFSYGKPDSAYRYLKAARKIDHEIDYPKGEAADLSNLGTVYASLGLADSARSCYSYALKIYRKLDDRFGKASVLGNFGILFRDLAQLDSAKVYFLAALNLTMLS